MKPTMNSAKTTTQPNRRQGGQTIVIAMIVLGILLILGFVFLGIVDHNIKGTSRQQSRTVANDLAEAGVRFAHAQLVNSEQGADWRGRPYELAAAGVNVTQDPDALYLRQPDLDVNGNPVFSNPNTGQPDLGGPDGMGPFIRIPYENGRSLVRVVYAPSDANIFSAAPNGALRNPGAVRNQLRIESIGRVGQVKPNDPTTQSGKSAVQFRNFASQADFNSAFQMMSQNDGVVVNSRKLTAFASIGIIEYSRFITNKYKVSRAADIGVPKDLGATYVTSTSTTDVGATLPMQFGTDRIGGTPLSNIALIGGSGSIRSNADLMVHGNVQAYLNYSLGDAITVSGSISGDDGATLNVHRYEFSRAPLAWKPTSLISLGADAASAPSMNSRSAEFSTAQGTVRDGVARTDDEGHPRGVGYMAPPSIAVKDPESGENRYVQMTRESGAPYNGSNTGLFGHGRGVYIDNGSDRQLPSSEQARQNVGSDQSLVYDWLNPNNGQSKSGWIGGFYIPVGAYVQLLNDGWTIQRDSRTNAATKFWRFIDGSPSSASLIRYRVGRGTDGVVKVINSLTPINPSNPTATININGNLSATDFDRGLPFNGILYFDGNVRVRGVIPTDLQLTIVSDATVYIEGSITKGVTGNGLQTDAASGSRLTRPSRSMIGIFAREYVAVNTSMFMGPSSRQAVEAKNDVPQALAYNPVVVPTDGAFEVHSEFALDPNGPTANPLNPSTWRPYATDYADAVNPGVKLPTQLVLTQSADQSGGDASFIGLNVNEGISATPAYLFPHSAANTASAYFAGTNNIAYYGLGGETYQNYPQFESIAFPLIQPTTTTVTNSLLTSTGVEGGYQLLTQEGNDMVIRPGFLNGTGGKDYLLARAALMPHDIRIEAVIYAEEGSFFVIPGAWFNANANDRRDTYATLGTTEAERSQARLMTYGANSSVPFYGEPVDVHITISGSVSENMPPDVSQQAQWIKKWGWIPGDLAATGQKIPGSHVPGGFDLTKDAIVPNLVVTYDPALATARTTGYLNLSDSSTLIRRDDFGRALPPLPRLPVSPTLAYFGEVN